MAWEKRTMLKIKGEFFFADNMRDMIYALQDVYFLWPEIFASR